MAAEPAPTNVRCAATPSATASASSTPRAWCSPSAGLRASHDDIAREAGVGVGTVYRRFPDKEQLIDALFEERIERDRSRSPTRRWR